MKTFWKTLKSIVFILIGLSIFWSLGFSQQAQQTMPQKGMMMGGMMGNMNDLMGQCNQ
jgi:lipoprotein signal peptidase